MKTLLIEIHFEEHITDADLNLRRILVDTIEARNLGEVIEVTSSHKTLEVLIETSEDVEIEAVLHDLLNSFGFVDHYIQNILEDNE